MFAAFKERRPWAAVIIALATGPAIAMLYLNRGRNALIYFGLALIAVAFAETFRAIGTRSPAESFLFLLLFSLGLEIAGVAHSYIIARKKSVSEPLHWYARWYSVVTIYLVLNFIFVVATQTTTGSFYIASGSMSPTLVAGDRILVDKFAYRNFSPRRGDVVVFQPPAPYTGVWVKRIVGVPGDRVQMKGGRLFINDAAPRLVELGVVTKGVCSVEACETFHEFVEILSGIPAHLLWKNDEIEDVDNTRVFRVPANSYFVLGDSRSNSLDSRMDNFGFVRTGAIVGKVAIKYYDAAAHRLVWQAVR